MLTSANGSFASSSLSSSSEGALPVRFTFSLRGSEEVELMAMATRVSRVG